MPAGSRRGGIPYQKIDDKLNKHKKYYGHCGGRELVGRDNRRHQVGAWFLPSPFAPDVKHRNVVYNLQKDIYITTNLGGYHLPDQGISRRFSKQAPARKQQASVKRTRRSRSTGTESVYSSASA